jgi:hypothetical protein
VETRRRSTDPARAGEVEAIEAIWLAGSQDRHP